MFTRLCTSRAHYVIPALGEIVCLCLLSIVWMGSLMVGFHVDWLLLIFLPPPSYYPFMHIILYLLNSTLHNQEYIQLCTPLEILKLRPDVLADLEN